MPLSEFLRMARGKLDAQPRSSPLGFSRGEDDFLELVWENGQLMMQGQSSRAIRNPAFPSDTPKFREPATFSRIGKLGQVESMLNDLLPVVPSAELDYGQDEDMVPWLNYSDDALPNYCSDFLPEISGLTGNGMSNQNSFASANKKNSCDDNGATGLKGSSSRPRLVSSWPQQASDPSLLSGVSDIISNNTSKHMLNGSTNTKMPSSNSNLLNFSHFSRPANLVKPDVPISDALPASVVSISERMEDKGKGLTFGGGDPVKLRLADQLNTSHRGLDFHGGPSATSAGSSKALPVEGNEILRRENSIKSQGDASKVVPDVEKSIEPLVASSSVGSGNSGDRASCEQTHNSKRKFQDLEESEFNGDDVDTDSVGVKKPTGGRGSVGSKRSRAAEVHNLSERRRRDRINEKMRALQELIPNCNKADKASMLDEAIEYLKTLQLQVQMMSMGAGLYMPPMMFPSGIHPAHMPHYSPMGIGMGMGFGMGMPDMNAGSSTYPMFPVPQMQGAHFPSSMPGPVNFQRIPGPNLPMYVQPSQGPPGSVPLAPLAPRPSVTSTIGLNAPRVGSQSELPGTSRPLAQDSKYPQSMHNAEASGSINPSSNKLQATNEDKSAVVQESKQPTDTATEAPATKATDVCKVTGGD